MSGNAPSPLRRVLDEHPLALLIGFAISVASVAGGTVGFFARQQGTIVQARHQQEVEELQRRLASIERRVGGETSFFDVDKLRIGPDRVRTLPPTAQFLPQWKIYVSPPPDARWARSDVTERGLGVLLFGPSTIESLARPVKALAELSKVTMWRTQREQRVRLAGRDGVRPVELTLFPYVTVQRTARRHLAAGARDVAQGTPEWQRFAAGVDEVARRRDTDADRAEAERGKQAILGRATEILEADLTAMFLLNQLAGGISMAGKYEGVSFQLLSAQKKGNVLYARVQTVFRGAGPAAPAAADVTWDKELVVITTPKDAVAVVMSVPSTGEPQPDHAWITQWLTGLYVVVDDM